MDDISSYITRYEKIKFQPLSPSNTLAMENKDCCEGAENDRGTSLVKLNVFGQSLEMSVRGSKSIFTPDAKIIMFNNGYEEVFSISDVIGSSVEGTVIGDNGSYVFGQLRNGIFDGVIRANRDTFYVERASKYFPQKTDNFNVIVYRERDVDPCPSNLCLFDTELMPLDRNQHQYSGTLGLTRRRHSSFKPRDGNVRKKRLRSSSSTVFKDQIEAWHVCNTKVIIDYTFFENVGNENREDTISELEILMREAQQVFHRVDVDGDGQDEPLMVVIQEVHIHRSRREPSYRLNDKASTAHDFLESLSLYDFSDFCIGFAFAYRPLSGSVLGLAYQGDPSPLRIGGACESPVVSEDRRKHHYNCGMMTLTNSRQEMIPLQMGALVVAHELAHLFGSSHDDDHGEALCTPDFRHGGHYIMYSHASHGNSPNNVQLSPCSQKGISAFLSKKGHCLVCHGKDCMHRASFDPVSSASRTSFSSPLVLVAILLFSMVQQQ